MFIHMIAIAATYRFAKMLAVFESAGNVDLRMENMFYIVCIIYDALVSLSDKVGSLKCSEVFYQINHLFSGHFSLYI